MRAVAEKIARTAIYSANGILLLLVVAYAAASTRDHALSYALSLAAGADLVAICALLLYYVVMWGDTGRVGIKVVCAEMILLLCYFLVQILAAEGSRGNKQPERARNQQVGGMKPGRS
jgi:hypothetical protein